MLTIETVSIFNKLERKGKTKSSNKKNIHNRPSICNPGSQSRFPEIASVRVEQLPKTIETLETLGHLETYHTSTSSLIRANSTAIDQR